MLTDRRIIELVRRADPAVEDRLRPPRHDAESLLAIAEERVARKTVTLTSTEPDRPATEAPRRLRPALAFGTAVIVSAAAIGIAILVMWDAGGGSTADTAVTTGATTPPTAPATTLSPEPSTTVPATTEATTATTQTTATTLSSVAPPEPATLFDGSWSGAALDLPDEGWLSRPVATSFGIVAPGGSASSPHGGVWISKDGVDWQLWAAPPGAGGIETIVEHESALYAFGFIEGADRQRVVWRSEDGDTWNEIATPTESPIEDSFVEGAATSGEALVAYMPSYRTRGTSVLVSLDGTTWSMVEAQDAGLGSVFLTGIIEHENGFLAMGIDESADPAEYADGLTRLYASATGEEWDPVPGSALPFDARVGRLVESNGDLYVGGHAGEGEWGPDEVALWRSEDGRTFARVDLDPAIASLPGLVNALLPTDRGLLVTVLVMGTDEGPEHMIDLAETAEGPFASMLDPGGAFGGGGATGVVYGDRIVQLTERDGQPYRWTWSPTR